MYCGGSWMCLVPRCVAVEIGCGWRLRVWRCQLDVIDAHVCGGAGGCGWLPTCVAITVGCGWRLRLWRCQLDVIDAHVCGGGRCVGLVDGCGWRPRESR